MFEDEPENVAVAVAVDKDMDLDVDEDEDVERFPCSFGILSMQLHYQHISISSV